MNIKTKIIKSLFPWLKLKDDLSLPKRMYVYFEIFSMIIIITWIAAFFYIDNSFKSIEYKKINLYSNNKAILKEANLTVDRIYKVLKDKRSIDLDNIEGNLYFIDNSLVYYLTTLPMMFLGGTPHVAYTIDKSIYFNHSDKLLIKDRNSTSLIDFKGTIAHELVHLWQNNRYGKLYQFKVKAWIQEGFAMYATGDMEAEETKEFLNYFKGSLDALKSKKNGDSYILWGLMVKHAIEDLNYSVDDVHQDKADYDTILHSLLKKYGILK